MTEVRAKISFEDGGSRSRGQQFTVSPQKAEQLRKRGLVTIISEEQIHPMKAAGEAPPLSASPVAQVSQQLMLKQSALGVERGSVKVPAINPIAPKKQDKSHQNKKSVPSLSPTHRSK